MIGKPISTSLALQAAFLLFSAGILLSISAVNLTFGVVPVRAICIAASLILITGAFPIHLKSVLVANQKLLTIIIACAFIGLIISALNQTSVVQTLIQLIEIHMQAVTGLILAAFFVQYLSIWHVVILFLTVWATSAICAVAQVAGLDIAWQLRTLAGDWMNDPAITRAFYDQKQRALGLSFTPVHLATQTCLAFAAFVALRLYQTSGEAVRKVDFPLLAGWLFAVLICIISGNRSPLIGFLVFLVIYLWITTPRFRMLLMAVSVMIILLLPNMQEFGREFGLRVGSTEDGSAVGRSTLWAFGFFLFTEHPLGYGLLFDSVEHANRFAHQAIHFDNSDIIRYFSLHNYYMLMLNKYGFLILFIIPWILPRNKVQLLGWLAFTPYLIHIAFHNEGPLNSDFLIWFLFPIFSMLYHRHRNTKKRQQTRFLTRTAGSTQ